jgi:hypothetical protein
MTLNFLARHRSVLIYGASLAALLFLMKWLEWRFLIVDYAVEVYGAHWPLYLLPLVFGWPLN